MSSTRTIAGIAAIVMGALAIGGCSAAAPSETGWTASVPTASASSAPSGSPVDDSPLDSETLARLFTEAQFDPDRYATTTEMFESIYQDITAAESCLAALGIGREDDPAAQGSSLAFGASDDRTLIAVANSFGDRHAAEALVADIDKNIDACIAEPKMTFRGMSVDATVQRQVSSLDTADTSVAVRLSATVYGYSVVILGQVAQRGGDVVTVLGWDSTTNATNVPLATELLITKLADAHH